MNWLPVLELRLEAEQAAGRSAAVLQRAALGEVISLVGTGQGEGTASALLRAVRLVASELGENLSKYSDWQHEERPLFGIEVSDDRRHLRLRTENHFDAAQGHPNALFAVLQRLRDQPARVAYRERLLEAAFEPIDASTRLGVLRMASEGNSQLDVQVAEQGTLRIFAVLAMP